MRFLVLFLFPLFVQSQTTQLSGIINRYAAVRAIDTCSGRIEVSDTAGFRAGHSILLIQMQGALISGDNNGTFGQVTDLNSAGRFERAVVDSVAVDALFLRGRMLNQYDVAGKVQAVSIPRFTQAVVTDTLRPKPWDGTVGGILIFIVTNTLTLHAPVIADGAGFRGGADYLAPGNNCTWLTGESGYYYPAGNWRGANKGEGIAAADSSKILGRGPRANGGGGGNDHNAGGGGGANAGAGGVGGDNDEPATFGCDGYYPGLPGRQLTPDTLRLFMGGGGGAGHANNNLTSAGGNGGGIILIEAGRIEGSKPIVSANGLPGDTANGDGGGGGGAGGTIWLRAGDAPDSLRVSASGSAGGNTININQNRCFGPGGGGGGGCIRTNLAGIPIPAGGPAGQITLSSNGCNGSSSGAAPGMPGSVLSLPSAWLPAGELALSPEIWVNPVDTSICPGAAAGFSVQTNPGNWQFQWEINTGAGWMPVVAGMGLAGFLSPNLQIPPVSANQNAYRFRCVVQRPDCSSIISGEALLTVNAIPLADFEVALNNKTAFFENRSQYATSYWWDFGDGTGSTLAAPEHQYAGEGVYTVTLYAISTCDTAVFSQTIQLLLAPVADFSAPDSVANCEAVQVAFVNQSSVNALGFAWLFPGGVPAASTEANPVVTYTASGVYPVTLIAVNAAGADTTVQTVKVRILGYPLADFSYAMLGGGLVSFTNLSSNADSYTWYFGDSTAAVQSKDALHQYAQAGVFTVTLVADNFCGTAVLQKTIEVLLTEAPFVNRQSHFKIFPNPTAGVVHIESLHFTPGAARAEVFDLNGRSVLAQIWQPGDTWSLDLGTLPGGVYLLLLRCEQQVYRRLIIRN
ncbi:MAG: PKD domain-containing protein [Thermoanaerobaculia bacterium]|nr:PKD domain-containing protein [Thermoanaerobaculia bacterium]